MGKEEVEEKSNGSLYGLGTLQCAEDGCETILAYFPANWTIEDEDLLEFYCAVCAAALSSGTH